MLLAIRDYIQQRQTVTLFELAEHFQLPPSVMLDRTHHWVKKGVIQQGTLPSYCQTGHCQTSCSSCTQVNPTAYVTYQWIGATQSPPITI